MSLIMGGKCCIFCDKSSSIEDKAHYQLSLFSSLQSAVEEAMSNHFDLELISEAEMLDIIGFCHELRIQCFNCNYEKPLVYESVNASVVVPYLEQMEGMEKAGRANQKNRLKKMGVVKKGNLFIVRKRAFKRKGEKLI